MPPRGGAWRAGLLVAWLGGPAGTLAAPPAAATLAALPEPLTLEAALAAGQADTPRLALASAERDRERAEAARMRAEDDAEALLQGRLRWIEPPSEFDREDDSDDHWLGLFLRKRLYDSGRGAALEEAGGAQAAAAEAAFVASGWRQRLRVHELFFAVLLADLDHAYRNEALAIAYVRQERVRERRALGQFSDLELLEHEAHTATALREFDAARAAQRASRLRLAQALNRPAQPPTDLAAPALPQLARPLPRDEAALIELALARNRRLDELDHRAAYAEARLAAARTAGRPTLDGEIELGEYSRETRTRDPARAGVVLEIPLYRGERDRALVAQRDAELRAARAARDAAELELREAVLETWQSLRTLGLERAAAQRELAYRELDLDRLRTLYELERRADLGDGMARFSHARLRAADADYRLALAWERLDALTDGAVSGGLLEENR